MPAAKAGGAVHCARRPWEPVPWALIGASRKSVIGVAVENSHPASGLDNLHRPVLRRSAEGRGRASQRRRALPERRNSRFVMYRSKPRFTMFSSVLRAVIAPEWAIWLLTVADPAPFSTKSALERPQCWRIRASRGCRLRNSPNLRAEFNAHFGFGARGTSTNAARRLDLKFANDPATGIMRPSHASRWPPTGDCGGDSAIAAPVGWRQGVRSVCVR